MRARICGIAAVIAALCLAAGCRPAPPDSAAAVAAAYPVAHTEAEWRRRLTPEQYRITREAGTERRFTGKYLHTKTPGEYRCVACGQPLFSSEAKYDSHTGWPSFWQPLADNRLEERTDYALGLPRTEVRCSRCGAHLGHVFDDGPPPTGKRYCLNSAALKLAPAGDGAS